MIEAMQRIGRLTVSGLAGAGGLAANVTLHHPTTFGFMTTSLLSLVFFGLFLRESEARRARDAALAQAARLEALGRLACGVAHDFNNLLMVIQGAAARLRRKAKEPTAEPQLDAIDGASEQAVRLVRQLLSFARSGEPQASRLDLGEAVENSLAAVRELVGPSVTVRAQCSDKRVPVLIDPVQLHAALLNLAANARDAMPSGGVLAFVTRAHRDGVELRISDTGEGVPPEVLPRVFEPFFTTKGEGKGTGLGLAQVHGLVRRAGGSIRIQSAVGQGAVVILRLPRAPGGAERLDMKSRWTPSCG